MEKLIDIKGLRKEYKDFTLDNVSFSLDPGYIMGFVGPNGAGKSTTIKLMLNLIKKDGGEIKLFGLDSEKDEIAIKERVGFVLDNTYFHATMTVAQVEWLVSGFYKGWDKNKFSEYCERFSLPHDKKVKDLSTGMKAKLAIATALSHKAKLLILDEPTSGLDPIVRSEILGELFKVVEDESCGVFFSTHITSDLDRVADFVTFIGNGQILAAVSRDEINERYAIIKGAKKHLSAMREYLIGVTESDFGFEGLTNRADVLKHVISHDLLLEKAKIEDILLYLDRRNAI